MESEFSEISNLNHIKNMNSNENLDSSLPTIQSKKKDSIKRYDSSLNVIKNDKPNLNSRRRHSQGNFQHKININNFALAFNIDSSYVPNNKSNFIFDLSGMNYIYHNKKMNGKSDKSLNYIEDNLLDNLIQQAKDKILLLKKTFNTFNNDTIKKSTKSLNSELISESSNTSSSNSSSDSSPKSSNKTSYKHSSSIHNISIVDHNEIRNKHFYSFMIQKENKSRNLTKLSYKTSKSNCKNSIKDSSLYERISEQLKEKKKVNFNYYEINLKNIRFLKYDFYKETIIEDKHYEKTSKMNELINEIKMNHNKNINNDENYPSINLNNLFKIKHKDNLHKSLHLINKKKKIEQETKIDFKKLIITNNERQN